MGSLLFTEHISLAAASRAGSEAGTGHRYLGTGQGG